MAKKQTAFVKKPNAKTGRLEYASVNRGNAKKTAPGSPLAKTKAPNLSGLKTKPNVLNPILTKKRK